MFIIPYLIHIPLILFFVILVRNKYQSDPIREYYYPAFAFKIIGGIGLALIYLYFYGGQVDTFDLFQRSSRVSVLLLEDPVTLIKIFLFNTPYPECNDCGDPLIVGINIEKDLRTLFYFKILTVINLFTFNTYWLTSAYMSFFSFLGFYLLSGTVVRIFNISKVAVCLALLFFPSVVLWSSGLMKESIVMGSICFLISIVLLWIYKVWKIRLKHVIVVLILAFLIFKIKYYYFAFLIPVLFSYSLVKIVEGTYQKVRESTLLQLLLFFGFFFGITILVTQLHPNLNLDKFSEALINSYRVLLIDSHGKNVFYFEGIEPHFTSMLTYMPRAVFIGLFRPLIGDTHNFLGFVTALENIVILLMFSISAVKIIMNLILRKQIKWSLELMAVSLYVIMLAFLLPIATPNWGSLVRYKVGYLPFFLLLIFSSNPVIEFISKKLYGNDTEK